MGKAFINDKSGGLHGIFAKSRPMEAYIPMTYYTGAFAYILRNTLKGEVYMLTVEQLEVMNQSEIDQIDRTELVDIQSVQIDPDLPPDLRMESYLEQIKNPYCFMCKDTVVRLRFEPGEGELRSRLKNFLISLKNNESGQ